MRHTDNDGFPEPCLPGSSSPKHTMGRDSGQFTEFHRQHDRSQDHAESAAGMSKMPIDRNELGRQTADARELLALLEMRRRVQPGIAERCVASRLALKPVTMPAAAVTSRAETVLQLNDLIRALDRRLPQVERSGELAIAEAALRLRLEACKRIEELEAEIAGRPSEDDRPATS